MRLAADPCIDTRCPKSFGKWLVEEQVIDAQARVALPMLAKIIPESEEGRIGMELAYGIGPSLVEQVRERFTDLNSE